MKNFILFSFLLFLLPVFSFAQFVTDVSPAGLNAGDNFGYTLDISGNTAIISALGDDNQGSNAGAVYFFEKSGAGWQQTAKLFAGDAQSGQFFGRVVAMSGCHALVGAPSDNDAGSGAGAVYFLQKTTGGWVQTQKVFAGNPQDGANFGNAIAICENWALIAAPGEDNAGNFDAGAVYLFRFNGNAWQLKQTLWAEDMASNDIFGSSVAITDHYLAVGAPGDDDKGASAGSVYIFYRDDYRWKFKAKMTASDGELFDQFGRSLALSGRYLVAGAPFDDDNGSSSGSAYLFDLRDYQLRQLAKITAFDGQQSDNFAFDLDIFDNRIIIGAINGFENSIRSGTAYYYQVKDNGQPVLQKKLVDTNPVNNDQFGRAVAISERYMAVGVPAKDFSSSFSAEGTAYIYDSEYYAPIISRALDVPDDEGGFVTLEWEASLLDNAAHELTHYSIWRSLPPGMLAQKDLDDLKQMRNASEHKYRYAQLNGVLAAFELVGTQTAHFFPEYSLTAPTLFDQSATNSGEHIFMVSYHTSDPTVFFDSEPVSAFSIDNIPPALTEGITVSATAQGLEIAWPESETPDLKHYQLYRGNSATALDAYATTKNNYFTDADVTEGMPYFYSVSAFDSSGNESELAGIDSIVFAVTALEPSGRLPQEFAMQQNYPNPFNPTTTINIKVAQQQRVVVTVFDAAGKFIRELANREFAVGSYAMVWNATDVSSGIYYIKMSSGTFTAVSKAILLK